MLPEQAIEISKVRFDHAKECLRDAKLLLAGESYRSAANRAYYAIFHAMRAVLALDGVDMKHHSGIISEFRKRYIKTGVFDISLSGLSSELSDVREGSDYNDFFIVSKADTAEQITEPYCRSILTEENGEAAARAIVCMDGVTHEAEKRASVAGLATLDYKRTITELVKTTVYDAVVPFLPQAPVWGSLTGVRPAKLARGMIERGMTRGEAAVELREHFHVSPERTALTIRAAATAMEMDPSRIHISEPTRRQSCSYAFFC